MAYVSAFLKKEIPSYNQNPDQKKWATFLTCAFTYGRYGVDARDPLSEESIGRQLGEFRTPSVHRQNLFLGYPVPVDAEEPRDGCSPLGAGLIAANQDSIRTQQVLYSGALCQKFRVR